MNEINVSNHESGAEDRSIASPLICFSVQERGWMSRLRSRALVSLVVFGWALVEIPLELSLAPTFDEQLAILFSKALLGAVVFGAANRVRWTEVVFMLNCILSILAVAPSLPTEMVVLPIAFWFSFVECLLKGIALLIFAFSRE
ncbi:hypothetical protein H3V53_32140 [Paraburkholderia bengalensis]|uniref:Uncharacterized protein n=1 Tax=Paraburkholderia bengalensis TaxID=2747562 RepID=A0ABU8J205_9BURK